MKQPTLFESQRISMRDSIALTVDSLNAYGPRFRHCCPLASKDTALDAVVAQERWSYLAPLKRLRDVFRWLREPAQRLRKPGGETRADGSLVDNQHRMGPITLEARAQALAEILSIQGEVNGAARTLGRPAVDILNDEEVARIRELIATRTWPQRWSGDEPRADEPFVEDDQIGLFGALEER